MPNTQVAYDHDESGVAANLAMVSRPFESPDKVYNTDTDADEVYSAANIADYRIAPVEIAGSCRYLATIPAGTPAGYRVIWFYEMAGASLAVSDLDNRLGVGMGYWTGTDWLPESPSAGGGLTAEEVGEAVWEDHDNRTLTGGEVYVTVVGPVVSSDDMRLIPGDDYLDAPRIPTFTIVGQPSLIGALEVLLTIRNFDSGVGVVVLDEIEGSVVDSTHVQVPLTSDETALLTPGGNYRFDIQVKFANGHYGTVTNGTVTVYDSWTDPSGA